MQKAVRGGGFRKKGFLPPGILAMGLRRGVSIFLAGLVESSRGKERGAKRLGKTSLSDFGHRG